MQRLAVAFGVMVAVAVSATVVRADDADTVAAINASSDALDAAFAARDTAKIRALMTADHITVTPYYDGPQSVDDQIASLPELDYEATIVGTPSVALLAPDVALRTFIVDMSGSFQGKAMPKRAFVNETLIKRDGKWIERFFQITAMSR